MIQIIIKKYKLSNDKIIYILNYMIERKIILK